MIDNLKRIANGLAALLRMYPVLPCLCCQVFTDMICSGRRPPCTSVTVVVELKQNSRCLFCSPPLPSPPLCLCQLHMTANSPNLPPSRVYTLTGWDSKHYYSFTLCKMQHVKLTWSGPVSGARKISTTQT